MPELGIYLVADGMGGARGGERASQLAVETVAGILAAAPHRDAATLLRAVEDANLRVFTEASRDPRLEGMGTTLVAVLETPLESGSAGVTIASVGDSRAWKLEGGKLSAITEDQTWVQEIGRPLGLDDESLKRHPMRHVLTMALGVAPAVKVKCYATEIGKGSLLLLSSDGLHGVIRDEQIERILNSGGPAIEDKCRLLVEAANDAGSPDNVTVVILKQKS